MYLIQAFRIAVGGEACKADQLSISLTLIRFCNDISFFVILQFWHSMKKF
jgi:hypothetical protein